MTFKIKRKVADSGLIEFHYDSARICAYVDILCQMFLREISLSDHSSFRCPSEPDKGTETEVTLFIQKGDFSARRNLPYPSRDCEPEELEEFLKAFKVALKEMNSEWCDWYNKMTYDFEISLPTDLFS